MKKSTPPSKKMTNKKNQELVKQGLNPSVDQNPKNETAKKYPVLKELLKEDAINIELNIVESGLGPPEIQKCIDHLQVENVALSQNELLIHNIKFDAFTDLFLKARKIIGGKNDIAALKISFGIDDSNKICLFFQPIGLVFQQKFFNNKYEQHAQYKIVEGQLYRYDKDLDSFGTPVEDIKNEMGKYSQKIRIKHADSERSCSVFRNYNEDNEIYGDVTSLIFSFQEIFAVFHDNNYKAYVQIYNCIRLIPQADPATALNKHGLLLFASNDKSPHDFNLTFESTYQDQYADLSHLCPPSCDTLIYQLEP